MPKRKPERDEAKRLYLQKKGKLTSADIAEMLGVKLETIRKWKCLDKWEEELKRPQKGGQAGNQNAKGHGAPNGNTNAETHGAYSSPKCERLSEAQQAEIENLSLNFQENALRELKRLETKRADLQNRIDELREVNEDGTAMLYLDRTMQMELPDSTMNYTFRSSAFSRRMTLEAELNRVEGRILKLLDAFRVQEAEERRLEMEKKKFEFKKQATVGIFHLGENGEVLSEEDDSEPEIIT